MLSQGSFYAKLEMVSTRIPKKQEFLKFGFTDIVNIKSTRCLNNSSFFAIMSQD